MIYVEDAFVLIAAAWTPLAFDRALSTAWDSDFIDSVSKQIESGRALSVQQAKIVLAMLGKVGHHLVETGDISSAALAEVLRFPQYRRPLYTSVNAGIRNEVRLLGAHFLGFRFRYNGPVVTSIRTLSQISDIDRPRFHRASRIWIVPVTRSTLGPIRSLITAHRFEMDALTRDYLTLAKHSQNKPSTMLHHAASNSIVANVCDNPLLACWLQHVGGGSWV